MRLRGIQPLGLALWISIGAAAAPPVASVPSSEVLSYSAEWRLIHAGNARLSWSAAEGKDDPGWRAELLLESAGLVSRLYKVHNVYSAVFNDRLCVQSSLLKAAEGSRRRETSVTFDGARGKASRVDRDLVKNTSVNQEIDIASCEYDVIGALYRLRTMKLEPGSATEIPISDGKKNVMARVEAQERETVKIHGDTYKTVRYEAFLFNNVLYRRKGRLFVWLTDDEQKLPVQIRIRMPFYIGTVTLQLQKERKS
jgi:hypothetical protein